jgi:hypothetical protein
VKTSFLEWNECQGFQIAEITAEKVNQKGLQPSMFIDSGIEVVSYQSLLQQTKKIFLRQFTTSCSVLFWQQ